MPALVMTRFLRPRRSATLVAILAAFFSAGAPAADWHWSGVGRVVAMGDVHGAYPAMLRTLQSSGLLDESLAWQGGDSHLVITGDILDRGPASRQVMDLLMRIEPEAVAAGGQVHLLLGNHEVMNLAGDLRYVSSAEYAAFAAEETAEERDRWYAAATARDAGLSRQAFDKAAPPGFFAHRRAFAADGRYGSWLLQKPLMIVINDTAFVHGGVTSRVAEEGLEGINGKMRGQLAEYVRNLATVVEAGYLLPTDNLYEHAERLGGLAADDSLAPETRSAVQALLRLGDADIHGQDSPLWYRGNVACSPLIETLRLEAALERIGAARVVIGHSPTPGREVLQRLDGRVYEIDTGMLSNYYGGSGHALIIEGETISVVGEAGDTADVALHPRRVDMLSEDAATPDLEALLANGRIVDRRKEGKRTLLTLQQGDARVTATFLPNPRTRGVVPELAAYRLDRLLDLGMVPATVAREVEGERGVVQFVPASTIDERQRSERGEGASAWCPLPEQWQAMYGFDALIFNPVRLPQNILYGRPDWQLVLIGHDDAFAPRSERPVYLRDTDIKLGDAWIEALAALGDDVLKAELGDVLDKRRLLALYQRRDRLLREARTPTR